MRLLLQTRSFFSKVPKWATLDPWQLSKDTPHTVANILDGQVIKSSKTEPILDPLNGGVFLHNSLPSERTLLDAYAASQLKVPLYGIHNPIRNVSRYMQLGEIFLKISSEMRRP
jgi:1-pyrroline-5-carboxylate dehydrogenase